MLIKAGFLVTFRQGVSMTNWGRVERLELLRNTTPIFNIKSLNSGGVQSLHRFDARHRAPIPQKRVTVDLQGSARSCHHSTLCATGNAAHAQLQAQHCGWMSEESVDKSDEPGGLSIWRADA
jgi:hypothetical protein